MTESKKKLPKSCLFCDDQKMTERDVKITYVENNS